MVGTEDQWGLYRKHSERGLRKWNGSSQIKHRLAIGAAANCTIPGFINILTKLMVVVCVDTLTVPMEPLSTLVAGHANRSPADS